MTRLMKDSGIKWIGDIPHNWGVGSVKRLFFRKNEKAMLDDPVVLSLARSGVKIRDISNNEGQLAESYFNYNPVKPGDLLLNPMDLYSGANCSISNVEGVISPAYINLGNKQNVSSRYYDYYFKTQYWAMALFAHGKGVSYENRWTLGQETLMNYIVPIPSYNEQQRIASFLDSKCQEIDNVLAKTRSSIEEYKKLKQAIITKAVTKGIRSNRKMKDSGIEWIGEIPEEWEIRKLSWLFNFIGGYAYKSDKYIDESDYQVLRIGNVKNLGIAFSASPVFIDENIAKETQNFKIKENYILFTMTGTKGKRDYFYTYLVKSSDLQSKSLFINQRVGALVSKTNCYPAYYSYLLKEDKILDSIFMYETGTANQGNLGIESINKTLLQFPPLLEQQEIAKYLDSKSSEINNLILKKEQLISELESYKKSLIYEYVTGKKEVPMA